MVAKTRATDASAIDIPALRAAMATLRAHEPVLRAAAIEIGHYPLIPARTAEVIEHVVKERRRG
jgi:hypothetical protein